MWSKPWFPSEVTALFAFIPGVMFGLVTGCPDRVSALIGLAAVVGVYFYAKCAENEGSD